MPKTRTLEPEFWDDKVVDSLSRDERLLCVAMITLLADDEGRFIAEPSVLKKRVFGVDADVSIGAVDTMLRRIDAAWRNLVLYTAEGQRYGFLVNFQEKQGIRYVVKSKLPPPPNPLPVNDSDTLPKSSANSPCLGLSSVEVEPPCKSPQGGTAKTKTSKSREGQSKLPDDWRPENDVIAAMKLECPGLDLKREHAKFSDYWRGTGKKRVDWTATWRNWMRKAFDDLRARAPAPVGTPSRPYTPAPEKPE